MGVSPEDLHIRSTHKRQDSGAEAKQGKTFHNLMQPSRSTATKTKHF